MYTPPHFIYCYYKAKYIKIWKDIQKNQINPVSESNNHSSALPNLDNKH